MLGLTLTGCAGSADPSEQPHHAAQEERDERTLVVVPDWDRELGSGELAGSGSTGPVEPPPIEEGNTGGEVSAAAAGAVTAVPVHEQGFRLDEGVSSAGFHLTEDAVRAILLSVGWPTDLVPAALRVSFCESGYIDRDTGIAYWKPWAIGDNGVSRGLFQIGISRPGWAGWFAYFGEPEAEWADPIFNARIAWRIYQYAEPRYGDGFGPWTCRPE